MINILHISSIGSLSPIQRKTAENDPDNPYKKESQQVKLRKRYEAYIADKINYNSIIWCHSGLTQNIDFIWVRAILNMRLKHPNKVKLHLHVPHKIYTHKGLKRGLETVLWYEYIDEANRVTEYTKDITLTLQTLKDKDKEQIALIHQIHDDINTALVDETSVILAVYDHAPTSRKPGGLRNAIEYAMSKNKEITTFIPRKY